MLNFLAKAAVAAVKIQATRAVNDAARSGYNSAKKRLTQKKGGKREYQSKASNSIKSRNAPRKRKK